jgi:hypothetical protein
MKVDLGENTLTVRIENEVVLRAPRNTGAHAYVTARLAEGADLEDAAWEALHGSPQVSVLASLSLAPATKHTLQSVQVLRGPRELSGWTIAAKTATAKDLPFGFGGYVLGERFVALRHLTVPDCPRSDAGHVRPNLVVRESGVHDAGRTAACYGCARQNEGLLGICQATGRSGSKKGENGFQAIAWLDRPERVPPRQNHT